MKTTRGNSGTVSTCLLCALGPALAIALGLALSAGSPAQDAERRGCARADAARPRHFPHRIWAACDFEGRTPDYGWFGSAETRDVPRYPGNRTALRGAAYEDQFAFHAGINPVPGPRMGKHNKLYLRYKLAGAAEAQFQHFNLTREDNHHIAVSGLREGAWNDVTLDFTRDSRRNDGSPGAMAEGDRMDDLKVFLGLRGDGKRYELLIDDVLFFVEDPSLPPDPEPFPRRVIGLWGFDTGEREKYWPGDLEIAEKPPEGASWRAARAGRRKDGAGTWLRLAIAPPRPVGERTRLRFRYHLAGAKALTVQIFDLTVMDNRHVRLTGLEEGAWRDAKVD
ncbi:MAG: hypothetical protein HY721_31265, partial [Planctomycetes bacterium]|nr:hypothetical protein [Planctomycetota bacterium]